MVPALPAFGSPGPPLGGGEHEALLLDRASSEQHVPVVLARLLAEGRRDEQHRRAVRGERPVQLGEADVVADRHPGAPELGLGRHDLLAGRVEERLAARLGAGRVGVEEMDLAVPGHELTMPVEEHARVVDTLTVELEHAPSV